MAQEPKDRPAGKKKRKRGMTGPIVGIVLSICVALMPLAMDLYTRSQDMGEIREMKASNSEMDTSAFDAIRQQAERYNAVMGGYSTDQDVSDILPYEQQLMYHDQEMMGWVEVPRANIKMVIHHGTDEDALSTGVGHLTGTSLPVGGYSSHCVLTAHSGMQDRTAFDDIRKLEVGDMFYLHVCDQVYAYRVYAIDVVWPWEMESLNIREGSDLCTLLTCTPYGVNDHRLLVHGERVPYEKPTEATADDAVEEVPATAYLNMRTLPFLLLVLLLIALLVAMLLRRRKRRKAAGAVVTMTEGTAGAAGDDGDRRHA